MGDGQGVAFASTLVTTPNFPRALRDPPWSSGSAGGAFAPASTLPVAACTSGAGAIELGASEGSGLGLGGCEARAQARHRAAA